MNNINNMNNMNNITFSSCWYILKNKFNIQTYLEWIDNFLSNVNNFYLVIYSDLESSKPLLKYLNNPKIKMVIKPFEMFYGYKYKDHWINNHEKNVYLNQSIDWKLNMLWNEKVHFVNETIKNNYFNTEFYGWCDIGYFRCRTQDLSKLELSNWPLREKIDSLNKDKIYYALINNNMNYIQGLVDNVNNKNAYHLPEPPIIPTQVSVAGGFFILHKDTIDWWCNLFDTKLNLYFTHNYLVKDDQIIIADCIFSHENTNNFCLCIENDSRFDNWFLFQRFLLVPPPPL